jgi:hypothetical protein
VHGTTDATVVLVHQYVIVENFLPMVRVLCYLPILAAEHKK